MRLFFKHLIRSIKKRPWQPIILAFTLGLSVAISITVLSLKSSIFNEKIFELQGKYGNSDIVISVNSDSESRFIFASDVKRILGDDTVTVGYYDLLLTGNDGEIIFGAATEFASFSEIFDISFSDYGNINEDNVSSSIIVTSELANRHSLAVGDGFSVKLFGKNAIYTVAGITSTPILSGCDVLLDIHGVMKKLAEDSVFAAVIGDDFKPCSTLAIKLSNGQDTQEIISKLATDAEFADKTITGTPKVEDSGIVDLLIDFAVILSFIMTSIVAFSCFSILERERSLENAAFSMSGAPRSMLNLMQYAEALIYWGAGTLIGAVLSLPLIPLVDYFIGFRYVRCELTFENILISSLMLILALFLTVTLFVFSKDAKTAPKGKIAVFSFVGITAVAYVLEFIIPKSMRFAFGVATVILTLIAVFLSASEIMRQILRIIDAHRCGAPRKPAIYYAVKNAFSVKALHNTMRLTALLSATLLCILTIIASVRGSIVAMTEIFDSRYTVLNGTARCYDKIKRCDTVSSVEKAHFSTLVYNNGYVSNLLSVTDLSVLSDNLDVTQMPTGNEAVISYAEAKMLSLEVGSSFRIDVGGVPRELTVVEIVRTGLSFILIDCEYFDINYNVMLPISKKGVSDADFLGEITAATADEITTVTKAADLLENRMKIFDVYINTADVLLMVILVFALIGLIDTTNESYRVRENEFDLYRIGGMSTRLIRKVKIYELAITTLMGVGVGIIGYFIALPLISETMYGMGCEMLYNLMMALK